MTQPIPSLAKTAKLTSELKEDNVLTLPASFLYTGTRIILVIGNSYHVVVVDSLPILCGFTCEQAFRGQAPAQDCVRNSLLPSYVNFRNTEGLGVSDTRPILKGTLLPTPLPTSLIWLLPWGVAQNNSSFTWLWQWKRRVPSHIVTCAMISSFPTHSI